MPHSARIQSVPVFAYTFHCWHKNEMQTQNGRVRDKLSRIKNFPIILKTHSNIFIFLYFRQKTNLLGAAIPELPISYFFVVEEK